MNATEFAAEVRNMNDKQRATVAATLSGLLVMVETLDGLPERIQSQLQWIVDTAKVVKE